MNDFVQFFQYLEDWGLMDAILPFLLIFTVLFASLQKTRIFGEGKKNFNIIVSAIISLLVVIPHVTNSYPPGRDVVEWINTFFPHFSLVVILILATFLLIGLFGGEASWIGGRISGWIAVLCFALIVYLFGGAAGWWAYAPDRWSWWGSGTTSTVIIILVFGIVIWFITHDNEGAEAKEKISFMKELGDVFKKK